MVEPSRAPLLVGRVASGINNIYQVRIEVPDADAALGAPLECRIKGKVLTGHDRAFNPLAPGDRVSVAPDPASDLRGWIVERLARDAAVTRWNRKRQAPQTLAANCDALLAVGSYASPPFRPRFLDRLLLIAELGGSEALLVMNKGDLGTDDAIEERLAGYGAMGYSVLSCSAASGQGIEALRAAIAARRLVALAGQSGVGKSALLNRLDATLERQVGALSRKYDRGAHTTRFAELVVTTDGAQVIDTPGIRELEVTGIEPRELRLWFRDFLPYVEQCAYPGCLCADEPGCAVRAAVEDGKILADRYESYLRILLELQAAVAERR